jgi:hypothetical protein
VKNKRDDFFDIWLLWSIGSYANGAPMISLCGVYTSASGAAKGAKTVKEMAKSHRVPDGVVPCQKVRTEKRTANHTYGADMFLIDSIL